MFNSLTTQDLVQPPESQPFTVTEGWIIACDSGIPPVLKLGQCVLADNDIIQRLKALLSKTFDLLTYLFCQHNWRHSNSPRGKTDVYTRRGITANG